MGNWTVFFSFVFVMATLLSAAIEKEQGFAATRLTVAMNANDNIAYVASTDGFLGTDFIYTENEKIYYAAKTATTFTGLVRAQDNTKSTSHGLNSKVYNEAASVINYMVGYNIAAYNQNANVVSVIINTTGAILTSLPKMIMWDYSYLDNSWGIFAKIPLFCLSAGFVITFVSMLVSAGQALLSVFKP